MGTMTHIAGRAAFSKAVDIVLKNADKDREKEITKPVDLMEKYMGSEKIDVDYNKVKELICDKEEEIKAFEPKEYWTVDCILKKERKKFAQK